MVRISVPAAIKTEAWVWRTAWKVTDGSPSALTARPQSRESLSGEMAARSSAIGVKTACQMGIRNAERAIQAALFVEKNDKLSYLPPHGLLTLASRSAPEAVVNEIIGEISTGERPSAAQIKRRISQAKQTEKRARESLQEGELEKVLRLRTQRS